MLLSGFRLNPDAMRAKAKATFPFDLGLVTLTACASELTGLLKEIKESLNLT